MPGRQYLLGVMASIVGPNQTCSVRGQTISENLAKVQDLLEYVEREDIRRRHLIRLTGDSCSAYSKPLTFDPIFEIGFVYFILTSNPQ